MAPSAVVAILAQCWLGRPESCRTEHVSKILPRSLSIYYLHQSCIRASSEARLAPTGRLRAFDVDPRAIEVARALEEEDPRFCGSSWSP